MTTNDPLLMEFEHEAAITGRVLERVPEAHLNWRPHEKSMTLGELAMHIAGNPGGVSAMLAGDSVEFSPALFANLPTAATTQEILDTHNKGVEAARQFLTGLEGERAMAPFRIMSGSQVLFEAPRVGVVRNIMLNHWIHHRGQMTVYLRMLGVSVPVVYGRSADEGAFHEPKAATA